MTRFEAEARLVIGTVVSARAGVLEEITFRWAYFLFLMMFVQLIDFIFGGFIFGHGLIWLFYHYLFEPMTNFTAAYQLDGFLNHPAGWYVGAGLLAANTRFQNGHRYQGPIGAINAWFIGMYFFYLALTYGLVSAIAAHFLYNFLIDLTGYIKIKNICHTD